MSVADILERENHQVEIGVGVVKTRLQIQPNLSAMFVSSPGGVIRPMNADAKALSKSILDCAQSLPTHNRILNQVFAGHAHLKDREISESKLASGDSVFTIAAQRTLDR